MEHTAADQPTCSISEQVASKSFVDGNKRIDAALFLWFLEKNLRLYRADGTKRLADNALVALTLMIAESAPPDKDLVVRRAPHPHGLGTGTPNAIIDWGAQQ